MTRAQSQGRVDTASTMVEGMGVVKDTQDGLRSHCGFMSRSERGRGAGLLTVTPTEPLDRRLKHRCGQGT